MGSVGDAYDNAMCESFFATLECELIDRRTFKSQIEARKTSTVYGTGVTPRLACPRFPTRSGSRSSISRVVPRSTSASPTSTESDGGALLEMLPEGG